jgi:hypothetical protein
MHPYMERGWLDLYPEIKKNTSDLSHYILLWGDLKNFIICKLLWYTRYYNNNPLLTQFLICYNENYPLIVLISAAKSHYF